MSSVTVESVVEGVARLLAEQVVSAFGRATFREGPEECDGRWHKRRCLMSSCAVELENMLTDIRKHCIGQTKTRHQALGTGISNTRQRETKHQKTCYQAPDPKNTLPRSRNMRPITRNHFPWHSYRYCWPFSLHWDSQSGRKQAVHKHYAHQVDEVE